MAERSTRFRSRALAPFQACSAHIENYHESQTTGNMLAVFYVERCSFSSPPDVLLSAIAWNCTSEPEENLAEIEAGAWGCVQDVPPVLDAPVTANGYLPGTEAHLNGPTYDPGTWYIAYSWSNDDAPAVQPGWCEAAPPGTWEHYTGGVFGG